MENILNDRLGGETIAAGVGFGRIPVLALGTFAVGTDAFVPAGFLPDTAAALHCAVGDRGVAQPLGPHDPARPVLGMTAAYIPYAYAVPVFGAVGVGAGAVSIMLCLYGFGAIAGNLLAGWGTDRRGAVPVLTLGNLLSTATFAVLALAAATHTAFVPLAGVAAVAWGAASWSQSPAQGHRLIAAASADAGVVVAFNASGIYLGIGLGTSIGGLLVAHSAVLLTVAAIAATATAGYVRWTDRG